MYSTKYIEKIKRKVQRIMNESEEDHASRLKNPAGKWVACKQERMKLVKEKTSLSVMPS